MVVVVIGRTDLGSDGERGAVTAEAAVVLPSLVLVLVLCLGGIATGVADVRCVDAARAAARGLARGESVARAREVAREDAPPGAVVEIHRSADEVRVTVRARVRLLGGLAGGRLSIPVGGTAVAAVEPGAMTPTP